MGILDCHVSLLETSRSWEAFCDWGPVHAFQPFTAQSRDRGRCGEVGIGLDYLQDSEGFGVDLN